MFGVKALSRYSTEELGVLAHECKEFEKHHINEASYKVEILKIDKDEHVKKGELGRVVVTDLFSHAMPLIRYETGDLAIYGGKCRCGLNTSILESVEGRSLEMILTTSGEKLSPFFVNPIMKDYDKIIQFQFLQISKKDYILKLVSSSKEIKQDEILEKYKKEIGNDANIILEYVDHIPTIRSGKRAYVVNEFLKNKREQTNV